MGHSLLFVGRPKLLHVRNASKADANAKAYGGNRREPAVRTIFPSREAELVRQFKKKTMLFNAKVIVAPCTFELST
jgi:hypothetical protein